jgi:hypothetical protein
MWIVQYQDTYKLYPFKHTTSSQAHTLLTFSTDLSLSPIKREPFPGPFKKTKSVVLSLSRQHHGLPRASLKWHVTRPYHQWILHPMSSMKMTIASSGNGWGNQINDVFTYLGTLESSGKRKAISNLVHIDLPTKREGPNLNNQERSYRLQVSKHKHLQCVCLLCTWKKNASKRAHMSR